LPDRKFINAGLWVSCVLFLTVALLAGVLAAVFAVVNTTTNPVEPIAGVFGLYVWNGIAGKLSDSMALK
jgi:ABC-type amino acid transport system permease subunit